MDDLVELVIDLITARNKWAILVGVVLIVGIGAWMYYGP